MSISSEVRKAGPFAGNDVITDFPFSFKVFSTADVLVVRADSKGAEYKLELGTDYTVSLNANQNTSPGGTVVKASPLVTGDKIVITSRVANLQPTDLTNQGGFYPAVINAALDRATIQIQQLSEKVDRSAKLPITRTEDVDALLSDIVVLADNLSSVNTVAGSIGSVNKVAGVSADVSTVAGNTANINAAVADLPALSAKVSKTGDTMTGPLSVPAGASGAQVPQAQEVVPRAGNVTMTGPLSVPAGASGAQVPQAQEASPPGEIRWFARDTAPAGFLKANGATVSRTTYAALFAAIGTTFGAGDGSTTFNLPDMRGYAPRAWDDGRGVDSGRTFGSAQSDSMRQTSFSTRMAQDARVGGWNVSGEISVVDDDTTGNIGKLNATVGSGAGVTKMTIGSASETRMKNIALLACIKF